MGLGLSFGKKKQSGTTASTVTKDEQTSQQQDSTKASTQTGTQSTNTTGLSLGSTTNAATQTQAEAGTKTTAGTTSTSAFSQDVLAGLEGLVSGLTAGSGKTAGVVDNAVKSLQEFDPNSYVDSSVSAAMASEASGLDQIFGGLSDQIGSGLGNNSMATLLAARAQGDSTARIEGVRANATAEAQKINQGNQAGAVSAAQSQNQVLTQFLDALKGGNTTTVQNVGETTAGTTTGSSNATGTTSEQNSQQSQTSSTQQLLETLSQLLTGNTQSTGTENSKTTGKTAGGGLSLSL